MSGPSLEKTLYNEEKVVSVLKKFLSINNKFPIPTEIFQKGFEYYCYTGTIGRYASLALQLKIRWLKLSPIDGNLIEYKDKQDYPNKPYRIIPLNLVDTISIVPSKWLMKKSLFYFEIIQQSNRYIFATKTEKCRKEWMDKIILTKSYADAIHQLVNIRYSDVAIDIKYDVTEDDKKYIEYFLNRFGITKTTEFEILDTCDAKYERVNSRVRSIDEPMSSFKSTNCKHLMNTNNFSANFGN